MFDIELSRPDREVGTMLSGEEVEKLREAVNWVRAERGLKLKDIALACDAPEHTVRNFAYRKSQRPDNSFLGKLCKYLAGRSDLFPDGFFAVSRQLRASARDEGFILPARYDIVRREVPISEGDVRRVYDRYCGFYLCFRRSHHPGRMSVAWMHIRPLNPKLDVSSEGLPLPRFTLLSRYADRFDPGAAHSYIVGGYVISRHGRLFFLGQHDGELKYMTLSEPSVRKFTYIAGLCLFTAVDSKVPFAARVVCQYLGAAASRGAWDDRIGVFSDEDFGARFENAEIVRRALEDVDVLLGTAP